MYTAFKNQSYDVFNQSYDDVFDLLVVVVVDFFDLDPVPFFVVDDDLDLVVFSVDDDLDDDILSDFESSVAGVNSINWPFFN